jgi:hypothetical protein
MDSPPDFLFLNAGKWASNTIRVFNYLEISHP